MDEIGPWEDRWERHRCQRRTKVDPLLRHGATGSSFSASMTGGGPGTDPLSVTPGRLRGVVGFLIGEMARANGLEVTEDFATIFPGLDGWFFSSEQT